MSKVLVTGGAGFIGSHVVERHLSEGNQVTVVDDLSMGLKSNLPLGNHNLTFVHDTISNKSLMKDLLLENDFDYIYLLAAIASVADTIERPLESHIVNQEANIQILDVLRSAQLRPKRIIFASSAAVYGNNPELPKTELSLVSPATPYAIDKFATEKFVLTYSNLYELPSVAVRFFNVYGPRQNPKSPYSGVLSIIVDALKNNTKFYLFGDGLQTRDFVYVQDVVNAMAIAEESDEMVGNVYNVATGNSVTLIEAANTLQNISGMKLNLEHKPERVGDIKHSVADISRLKERGYAPKYTFEDGAKAYWESLS